MSTEPENQEKEEKPRTERSDKSNEDIAKQIPTVTPDQDNLEPVPDAETKK